MVAATAWVEGQFTSGVYTLIHEAKYPAAATMLEEMRVDFPSSRAVLSLLGYCYYHTGAKVRGPCLCLCVSAASLCSSKSALRSPP